MGRGWFWKPFLRLVPGGSRGPNSSLGVARSLVSAPLWQVAQHYIKFPGFESVPAGLGAVTTALGSPEV